ncbi:Uncharacterised protein [Clostridium fallax]|uniref:Uncharacterized protein n=1 Tax=Clostridium fallax TaxID=1533 RepID=A0A1M4XHN6_9CLOT|nr:hypothetical protein SAMN05443638_11839 [Clostridium fallax]SQB06391.1 Uncharacterised protein [Clostridium fallax]
MFEENRFKKHRKLFMLIINVIVAITIISLCIMMFAY